MSWKTLGEALETAIAMGMESGEMGVDAPSQPKLAKSAPTEAGASFTGQRQRTGKPNRMTPAYVGEPHALPASREMIAATPNLPPRRAIPMQAAVISLVVDNGSRRAPLGEEAMRPAGHARAPRDERASKLRLVVW